MVSTTRSRTTRQRLVKTLDKLCSEIVREREKCERCGNTEGLHCHHIFSRSYKAVRWDFINLLCVCKGCHFWIHLHPNLANEFYRNHMGEDVYYEILGIAQAGRKWQLYELEELIVKLNTYSEN